ncbi:uracil-DNA glycosylase [Gilvibacter sp.]|uniref:uracil-DNA glycosylase n=1 Tax=Gilvibacter sp. TaxID=2729997 RepID=UPI003F49D9F2
MQVKIEPSWSSVLEAEFEKDYFKSLTDFVRIEYQQHTCYPPGKLIFNAFNATSFDQVKVVIIGQDPYHGPGQAEGLCFSVPSGIATPPSLINIYKELESDIDFKAPNHGNLKHWADQGILLLNATLTVRAHQAGSHQNKGWEQFTDAVIQQLNEKREGLVFLLWGGYAKKKGRKINRDQHLVLETGHPSPLSANRGYWFGNKHFSKTNDYLETRGTAPINW